MNYKKIISLITSIVMTISLLSAQNPSETHSIYFNPSSAALQEQVQKDLYRLRQDLANVRLSYYVEIHAHTDNVGSNEENNLLSKRRGDAVINFLQEAGFDVNKIKRYTYGEEAPKSDNNIASGRQENRRVDLLVFFEQEERSSPIDYSYTERKGVERMPAELMASRKQILDEAQRNLDEGIQLFDIDPLSDTLIVCNKGTAIYVPAKTFTPIADKNLITLAVREVYEKSDMVLTNFTTSSAGRILESGGMIFIKALDGGKEYSLPLQHDLSFFFPTKEMRGDMDLFFGEADVNGNVDWTLAGRKISDYEGFVESEEEETPNGNYFDNLGLKKRRRVVNKESNIICINQGMFRFMGTNSDPFCTENMSCPLLWCQMEKLFQPQKFRQKRMAEYKACLESFIKENKLANDMAEGDLAELIAELEQRYGNNPKKMREALEQRKKEIFEKAFEKGEFSIEAMNFYVFSTRRMGAINCDAFPITDTQPDLLVFDLQGGNCMLDIKLVLKDRNSVISGGNFFEQGKVYFSNIPKGLKVCLVAIDYTKKGATRLSIQEFETGKRYNPNLEFKEYTSAEALKKALETLDS